LEKGRVVQHLNAFTKKKRIEKNKASLKSHLPIANNWRLKRASLAWLALTWSPDKNRFLAKVVLAVTIAESILVPKEVLAFSELYF
jgi:hypothetical protein